MHTFLKDGLKDILSEQSAHMLSDTTVVRNGNKWPVHGFVGMRTGGSIP